MASGSGTSTWKRWRYGNKADYLILVYAGVFILKSGAMKMRLFKNGFVTGSYILIDLYV